MANPEIIDCLADEWTKILSSTQFALIWNKSITTPFLYTNRVVGGDFPTTIDEGIRIFKDSIDFPISLPGNRDIYLYAKGRAGSVRVDQVVIPISEWVDTEAWVDTEDYID